MMMYLTLKKSAYTKKSDLLHMLIDQFAYTYDTNRNFKNLGTTS